MRQIIFLKFLKNNCELCFRWMHNIGNAKCNINNFDPKTHRVVCIDHFHADCFERNMMSELLTNHDWRKKNKLCPGAIPTIFKHKVYVINWTAQLFHINHLLHKNVIQRWKELD